MRQAHDAPEWDATHPAGQLYDLAADPGETDNRWSAERDVVASMYEELKKICADPANGLPFDVDLP